MTVIISDLDELYGDMLRQSCDVLIHADGKYAPCQGCFGCWTKHPAKSEVIFLNTLNDLGDIL